VVISDVCECFCQERADESESRALGRWNDTGGCGEPAANDVVAQLNGEVDLSADVDHDDRVLRQLSELADKYWTGPTSLLNNEQFNS